MTLESSFLALLRSSSIARDAATSCGDELTLEVVECAQPMAVRGGRERVGESSVEKKAEGGESSRDRRARPAVLD